MDFNFTIKYRTWVNNGKEEHRELLSLTGIHEAMAIMLSDETAADMVVIDPITKVEYRVRNTTYGDTQKSFSIEL